MRGTIVSINSNNHICGKINTFSGDIFVYKLPKEITVGDKISYDTRISKTGNEYAIYAGPYNREVVKVDNINFEKRMTSKDYIILYYYYLVKTHKKVAYSNERYMDWILTEELIEEYNSSSEDLKMDIEELSKKNYSYFRYKFDEERWNYEKPVIWKDRKKTDYYINQLTQSHKFEVYVDKLFSEYGFDIGLYYGRNEQYSGETKVGIEIKQDKMLKKTKNVYIEYQERLHRGDGWVNSGILKDDNTRFILIGDIDKFYILPKNRLVDYYKRLIINKENIDGIRLVKEKERGTSKGYIMSEKIAARENKTISEVINECRESKFETYK